MATITDINGEFSTNQIVSLRDTRIAWSGTPDREYEAALKSLCNEVLSDIGQTEDATGVEIKDGKIVAILTDSLEPVAGVKIGPGWDK